MYPQRSAVHVHLAAERRLVEARKAPPWEQEFSFAKNLYARGKNTNRNSAHVQKGLQPHVGLFPHAGLFPSGDKVVN